jgi:hypothetical protein
MDLNYSENIILRNILKDPAYFDHCREEYFTQKTFGLTFKIAKIFFDKYGEIPTSAQVKEAVRIGKKSKEITDGEIDAIFGIDLSSYSEEWLKETTEVFIEYKTLTRSAIDAVQYIQTTPVNAENIKEVVERFKAIVNERNQIDFEFDEGLDFFTPENHRQLSHLTFPSGYPFLDTVLGGGFSAKSLICLVGSAKIGKCFLSFIKVRNKKTGEIMEIPVETFFQSVRKD